MNNLVWIALAVTLLMVAGHILLFWWFVLRRRDQQDGKTANPSSEAQNDGTEAVPKK